MAVTNVYSATLDEQVNLTGTRNILNATPNLWVVKQVTVFCGSTISFGVFKLFGVAGNVAAYGEMGLGFARYYIQDLRVTYPPGSYLQYATDIGCDVGVYGYELTLP